MNNEKKIPWIYSLFAMVKKKHLELFDVYLIWHYNINIYACRRLYSDMHDTVYN